MNQRTFIISLDPGDSISGFVVLKDGNIVVAQNLHNELVFDRIIEFVLEKSSSVTVLIEDIRPYGANLSPQIIETCKFLGELRYRLHEAKIGSEWIPRSSVKKWVFDSFPEIVLPLVNKKIRRGLFLACEVATKTETMVQENGKPPRKASFVWIDDRIIISVMKKQWNIETPKPGKTNRYGIKSHAWQSLALASYHIQKPNSFEAGEQESRIF